MAQKPKRPPSVWISQILLSVYFAIQTLGLVSLIFLLGAPPVNSTMTPFAVVASMIGAVIFLAVEAAAFAGLALRKSWGRWLTVGIFALLIVGLVINMFSAIYGESSPAAYKTGQVIGASALLLPFVYLVFRLAVGDAAHDFFNPPEDQGEMFEPPPPPTFES